MIDDFEGSHKGSTEAEYICTMQKLLLVGNGMSHTTDPADFRIMVHLLHQLPSLFSHLLQWHLTQVEYRAILAPSRKHSQIAFFGAHPFLGKARPSQF